MDMLSKKGRGKTSHWFKVMLLHVRIMEMTACNACARPGTGASWTAPCAASRTAKAAAKTTSPSVTLERAIMNIEYNFWTRNYALEIQSLQVLILSA